MLQIEICIYLKNTANRNGYMFNTVIKYTAANRNGHMFNAVNKYNAANKYIFKTKLQIEIGIYLMQ